MKDSNYIVEDDVDEIENLRISNLRGKFSNRVLNLTIAPTLNCNFSCPYCYERVYVNKMPEEVPLITKFVYEKRKIPGDPILIVSDNIGYYDCHDINIRSVDLSKPSYFAGCMAGLFNVGIDSVGNVRRCESLYDQKFVEGNLREETLEAIWNRTNVFSYNRKFEFDMLHGRCKGCDKGCICAGGCRHMSYFCMIKSIFMTIYTLVIGKMILIKFKFIGYKFKFNCGRSAIAFRLYI